MKPTRKQSIIYLVLASILWSTGGLLIKLVPWHPVAISGMRSGIAALLMYFYIRKVKNINTREIFAYSRNKYFGALCYAATVILFVIANKLTTAANTILLQYSAPIWVALIAHFFLKERVQKRDWMTVALVFAGMSLFFMDDIDSGSALGNILAIGAGISLAMVVIMLRYQAEGRAVEMTFLGNLMTFGIALPFYFHNSYSLLSLGGILLLGVFQLGLAYILFSEGAPNVSSLESILIPVIEPLLNPIWVLIFHGEKVGTWAIVGGTIVVLAIIIKSLLDRNDGLKQSKNLKAKA